MGEIIAYIILGVIAVAFLLATRPVDIKPKDYQNIKDSCSFDNTDEFKP